jgi:hypothetical protein
MHSPLAVFVDKHRLWIRCMSDQNSCYRPALRECGDLPRSSALACPPDLIPIFRGDAAIAIDLAPFAGWNVDVAFV